MKSRGFSQLANGIVAALLLSACAPVSQDRPKPVVPVAPPAVEIVQLTQPILPELKPGTKKRAPAKPVLDVAEEAAVAPTAAPGEIDGAAGAAEGSSASKGEESAGAGPGAATWGTDGAGASAPGTASPGTAGAQADEVGVLLGTEPPNPAVVAAEPEPEPVQAASAADHGSPDDLRGQTEIQVINVLGSPLSTRAEGTSTIWSYRSEACTLDIYFFLDVADNQRRALSYELTARQAGVQTGERCYRALKAAAAAN